MAKLRVFLISSSENSGTGSDQPGASRLVAIFANASRAAMRFSWSLEYQSCDDIAKTCAILPCNCPSQCTLGEKITGIEPHPAHESPRRNACGAQELPPLSGVPSSSRERKGKREGEREREKGGKEGERERRGRKREGRERERKKERRGGREQEIEREEREGRERKGERRYLSSLFFDARARRV